MKKCILYLFIVLSILLIISGCSSNNYQNYVNVDGIVYDFTDTYEYQRAEGLHNVTVKISGSKHYSHTTYTNNNGYFSFENVPAGEIKVEMSKDGYVSQTRPEYLSASGSNYFTFFLWKSSTPSGSISGNIEIASKDNNFSSSRLKTDTQSSIKQQSTDRDVKNDSLLVRFKDNINTSYTVQQNSQIKNISRTGKEKNIYKIKTNNNEDLEKLYQHYKNQDNVDMVQYNYRVELMNQAPEKIPNDEYLNLQWHLENIEAFGGWYYETGSSDVTVAVIDTGYNPHEDLIDNLDTINDYSFPDNKDSALDIDAYYNSDNDYRLSHGTHVAGIIGAVGNNNTGISGVNWNINILPLRVFSGQYGDTAYIIEAIEYAIERNVDVINLSLAITNSNTSSENNPLFEEVLKKAKDNNITVVASAGNDGPAKVYYPASSDYTIAVGATNYEDKLSDFSNSGIKLDLVAPGENIYSTNKYYNQPEDDYKYASGTSMSAPLVSGAAALLIASGEDPNPDNIKNILVYYSNLTSEGHKLLNIRKALEHSTNNSSRPYEDVQIYAALKTAAGGKITYNIVSSREKPDSDGNYYIANTLAEKNLAVIGWIDSNNNGTIDEGDYFGEYENLHLDNGEHKSNINFSLTPVEEIKTANTKSIEIKFNLPVNK